MEGLGARRVASFAGVFLSLLCLVRTARSEELEHGLRVDYDPPKLSVEARETSLAVVLRAIGTKAGFSVVETVPSSRLITLSIRNAPLDDVLRQLLRTENHTVRHRAGAGATPGVDLVIDRIVLWGEPRVATPVIAGAEQGQDRLRRVTHDPASPTASSAMASPTSPQPWPEWAPLLSWDGAAAIGSAGDPAAPPMTVTDILKAHAIIAASATLPASLAATPAPASSTPQLNLDAALAETTRRAQQALGALIDGLATATRSLHESRSAGGK